MNSDAEFIWDMAIKARVNTIRASYPVGTASRLRMRLFNVFLKSPGLK